MAKKPKHPDGIQEYKDKRGKKRMRHYESGRITSATPQGYENRTDMINAIINASINQLVHYQEHLDPVDLTRIKKIQNPNL